jgi:hypothetical protein
MNFIASSFKRIHEKLLNEFTKKNDFEFILINSQIALLNISCELKDSGINSFFCARKKKEYKKFGTIKSSPCWHNEIEVNKSKIIFVIKYYAKNKIISISEKKKFGSHRFQAPWAGIGFLLCIKKNRPIRFPWNTTIYPKKRQPTRIQ